MASNKLGVKLALAAAFTCFALGGFCQSSETYRARVIELEKDSRDVAIQIASLQELINTTPAKVDTLQEYIGQLEDLNAELTRINQNNLIKLLLLMSYEVYNTIDGTAGASKAAVESFVNLGIRYTLSRTAFETAGAEAQKAMGLDSKNYLSPRNVAVRRVSEAALAESVEVAKVHVALNRDLNYYRALVQAEQGSDPGETGAILRKNLVVREQITLAIAALNRMRNVAITQMGVAETDLAWLEGEAESIAGLLTGVRLQLAEALAEELALGISSGVSNLQAQVTEPPDPQPFSFSYPPNDPENPDPDYHHNYYTARYQAGATRVVDILSPVLPALETTFARFTNQFGRILGTNAPILEWVTNRTEQWERVAQLPPDAFRALHETYYDIEDVKATREELHTKKQLLAASLVELKSLEPLLLEFNNLKRQTKGADAIATASAYTISEPVPSGETPRPVLGYYTLEHYLVSQGLAPQPSWGEEDLESLPEPDEFHGFFTYVEDLEAWEPRINAALVNLDNALDCFKNHLAGLQNAYLAELARERSRQQTITGQADQLLEALRAAETLSASKPYCAPSAMIEYLDIHQTFWNKVQLSRALAQALDNSPSASTARSLWQDYRAFIPTYQEIDRRYRAAAYDLIRSFGTPSTITALRVDLEAAHGAAALVQAPAPVPTVAAASEVEVAYYEAANYSREVLHRESARALPDCALLDPMPNDTNTPNAYLVDSQAMALPVYGLVLIQEDMEKRFADLMDMTSRNEEAMWTNVYAIAAAVDAWKATHKDVMLAYDFHATANRIKEQKLYAARMAWEAAFSPPVITGRPNFVGIPPGQKASISVQFTSHKPVTCTWYIDNWFGDDEEVGTGTTLLVSAPSGLEQYYCVIANAFGEVRSGRIDVVPAAAPKIAADPLGVTVEPGAPAQLNAGLYLTSAYVEENGQWFVSLTESQTSLYRPIPGATTSTLNLKNVIASRWYYYLATNPWGSTRSAAALVNTTTGPAPRLLNQSRITGYVGVPLLFQLDGAFCNRFEWAGTAPSGWNLDQETGVLSGTPAGSPGQTLVFPVRAVRETPNYTNLSPTLNLELLLQPGADWEGPVALRYFSPEEAADPHIGGPEADPDGDGIPNKTEYLLGLSPRQADNTEAKPLFILSGGQAIVALERSPERNHATYSVETSADLTDWGKPLSVSDNVVETSQGRESVAYSVSVTNAGFMRVRVHDAQAP